MKQIKHFMLPAHTNELYKNEAISSISLTKEVASKINELVDAYNELNKGNLAKIQEQDGKIRKGILYMKDNLINTLNDLLENMKESGDLDELIIEAITELSKEINILFESRIISVKEFGATGNGITNDIEAIENAIAALEPGDTLLFPKGTYLMNGKSVKITKENITFTGEGLIICDYGFRPTKSNFKAIGLNMESNSYSENSRAFMIDKSTDQNDLVSGFLFKDCHFENFFYSVACIGGNYRYGISGDDEIYPVRDIVIENCYSSTYTNKNAGHFQCIQVENISYINNRTYGGQNASSYNAIKGNGFIRVVGNYDHNNSYASCEIENGSGKAIIGNNTFNSQIWIDDSFEVVVNGNTTKEKIYITVGSDNGDSNNIIVSNNICKNIRCEQFGTYKGGKIKNINITGNNIIGDSTHGIWLHGNAVEVAKVSDNIISGSNTNDISIQRYEGNLVAYICNNIGNGKKILIAGSGGKVFVFDNYNFTISGNRDSLPSSHFEREFNGIRVTDESNQAWRIGINTSGDLFTTKY